MFKQAIFDLLDREFDGKSWNGPALMPTLERLDAATAANQQTWEGYSAWEVANHCAVCKIIILDDLGIRIPDWPYGKEQMFPAPTEASDAAWRRDLALYRQVHKACMQSLQALTDQQLATPMPSWKAPWYDIIAWLCTHDAFHGAQLRSMGVPGLKEPKH